MIKLTLFVTLNTFEPTLKSLILVAVPLITYRGLHYYIVLRYIRNIYAFLITCGDHFIT